MSVYMIVEIEIKDETLYSEYITQVYDVVVKHGGKYLVRGGQITPMSGDWKPDRIIIIEFDSIQQIDKCFNSAEYQTIAPLRKSSTNSRSIIVESHKPE